MTFPEPTLPVSWRSTTTVVTVLRFRVSRLAWRPLLALLIVGAACAAPVPVDASQSVFTPAQLKELKHWGVAPVVPSHLPGGFTRSMSLDRGNHTYDIKYRGPGAASFVWEGGPSSVEDRLVPKQNKLVSFWNRLFKHQSAASSQANSQALTPQSERDPSQNDVAASSLLIGPVHFKPMSGCGDSGALGVSERGIGSAKYSLKSCNITRDDLIRIYRSAVELSAP